MTIKDLSIRLAAVSLIADEAKRAKDRLRVELQNLMDEVGADRVKAELGDETVAFVLTAKPKFKWEVINERKFVEWCLDNCANEVITSVRESSRDAILNRFEYVDDLVVAPNGEVVDWLIGNTSEPYLMTKFSDDGREKLKGAMMSNVIDPRKVLELE
jgi:hypothetical protein